MSIPRICFDRTDRVVGEFLTGLGFGAEVIERERVTPDDMRTAGVNSGSLYLLATSDSTDAGRVQAFEHLVPVVMADEASSVALVESPFSRKVYAGDCHAYLTASEVQPLVARYDPRIPAMFRRESAARVQLLANILSIDNISAAMQRGRAMLFGEGQTIVVSPTPPEIGFSVDELRHIHYRVGNADPSITRWGKSVYHVTAMTGGGSAVLAATEGMLLSAYHVLFNDLGQFNAPLVMEDGRWLALDATGVVVADKANDFAVVHVPQLQRRTGLAVARQAPSVGTPVVIIGFSSRQLRGHREQLYTMGRVIAFDAATSRVTVGATANGGYSGGAMINLATGELIGITQGGRSRGRKGSFGVAPESTWGSLPPPNAGTK